MPDEEPPESLTDVADQLEGKSAEDGDLTVQDALDEFAGRLFGPLLVAPGLVVMTPVGGIPFVPTTMAVFVILVAGQALLGRKHPWLPGLIADRGVSEEKFEKSIERLRPWMEWVDKFTAKRMTYMVSGPMKHVIAAVCILMACVMPPLELLPFACIVPGAAILLLGLAITARDGLLAVVGVLSAAPALYLLTKTWSAFSSLVGIG